MVSVLFSTVLVKASDTGSTILGAAGSVLINEGGHATATYLLGGDVIAFRPYPHKVKYQLPDGSLEERWVAGLVIHKPFQGEAADFKRAWVAAMGSGANLLSVFLFAPLLPQIKNDFSRSTLDSILFFSSFDMAAYAATDLYKGDNGSDWTRVSKLTGVSLYWYLLGGLAGGVLANEYRYYWHKRAMPDDKEASRWSVGFSSSY